MNKTRAKHAFQPRFSDYRYVVGIDTGVETGFAVWDVKQQKLIEVSSLMIHTAIFKVQKAAEQEKIFVRVEDARQRKYIPWHHDERRERGRREGAGSVKRDAKMWEDFLESAGIPYELVAPRRNKTKLKADIFTRITNWKGKTNQHGRDAAMLVFGCK